MFLAMTETATAAVQWGVVLGVCLAAAIWDLARRRVPNYLVVPVFLGGLAWGAFVGGIGGLGSALAGSVLLSVPYVLLFAAAGGGAGDAKLMAAIGAWLGVVSGLLALAGVSVVAVAVGVAVAVRKRKVAALVVKMSEVAWWTAGAVGLTRKEAAKPDLDTADTIGTMPYAVVIAVGVCLAGVVSLLRQIQV